MVKAKYIKRCHILAEMTYAAESKRLKTRQKRGDYRKFYCFGLSSRYKRKGCSFALVYESGTILVKISLLKGKGLNLRAGPPRTKLY